MKSCHVNRIGRNIFPLVQVSLVIGQFDTDTLTPGCTRMLLPKLIDLPHGGTPSFVTDYLVNTALARSYLHRSIH